METLKTGRKVVVAILIFLAGVIVAASYRRTAVGDYGRLLGEQLPVAPQPVVTRTIPVVTEGPSVPASSTDPMLAAPAASDASVTGTFAPSTPTPTPMPSTNIAITNDGSNISIVRSSDGAARPHLTGGIFKQQQ